MVRICFGKDDFVALNSQFYINEIEMVSGTFYNVEEYVRHLNSELPTNLNMVRRCLSGGKGTSKQFLLNRE